MELELLPLDDDEPDLPHEVASERPRVDRRLGLVAVGLGVLVVLAMAAATGRVDPPVEVMPRPTPPVTVAAPLTNPGVRGVRVDFVVPSSNGRALLITSHRGSRIEQLPAGLASVTSAASGRGFLVVVLSTGDLRRFSDLDARNGTPLGRADIVFANPRDPAVVWAVSTEGDGQTVRAIVSPPETRAAQRSVPAGWEVVGSTGRGLVLTNQRGSTGIAIWEPWADDDALVILDDRGTFVASNRTTVAWYRDGLLHQWANPFHEVVTTAVPGDVRSGGFSPDGQYLALVGRSSDGAGWVVRFLSGGDVDDGFLVASFQQPAAGWTAQGTYVVAPGDAGALSYDPRTRQLLAT
jgi:hypothetical protein